MRDNNVVSILFYFSSKIDIIKISYNLPCWNIQDGHVSIVYMILLKKFDVISLNDVRFYIN